MHWLALLIEGDTKAFISNGQICQVLNGPQPTSGVDDRVVQARSDLDTLQGGHQAVDGVLDGLLQRRVDVVNSRHGFQVGRHHLLSDHLVRQGAQQSLEEQDHWYLVDSVKTVNRVRAIE